MVRGPIQPSDERSASFVRRPRASTLTAPPCVNVHEAGEIVRTASYDLGHETERRPAWSRLLACD